MQEQENIFPNISEKELKEKVEKECSDVLVNVCKVKVLINPF